MCTMQEIEARVKRLQRNKEQIDPVDMPKYEKALNAYTDGIVKDTCRILRENTQKDDYSEVANLSFLIALSLVADDMVPGVKDCNMDQIWQACLDASRFYPIIKNTIDEWDYLRKEVPNAGTEI